MNALKKICVTLSFICLMGLFLGFKGGKMKIESLAFQHKGRIPSKYTCGGENMNPPLTFLDIPKEAKSLALIMDDPDAPMGTWVHWTIWNIDPKISKISENSSPKNAIEGMTSFGNTGYGGPCPPSKTHRYFFKLYALDTKIELPSSANKAKLEETIEKHILSKTELMGLYSRNR